MSKCLLTVSQQNITVQACEKNACQDYRKQEYSHTVSYLRGHGCETDVSIRPSNVADRTDQDFGRLANEWLELKKAFVKNSTYARYRYLLDNHICPCFGNMPIGDIEDTHLQEMLHDKYMGNAQRKLSEKTIQDILSVFRLVIYYAEEMKYVPPGKLKMKIPPFLIKKREKIEVMKTGERLIFEEYLLSNKQNSRVFGILLAMYTGLRIGELCALRWKDIDLENKILYVNHTLLRLHNYSDSNYDTKTKVILDTPKTRSSCREIPLTAFLSERLSELYRRCGGEEEYYLLTGAHEPEEPRSYLYFYKRQLKICGLPEYTFHALRHTFATRCVEEGFDIKSLSEILGHSNVKITLDRYVHPSLDTKRRQMELLAAGR